MATDSFSNDTILLLADLFAKEVIADFPYQVQTFDSNGYPVLTLSQSSTPTAGQRVAVIRVSPIARATALNVLGTAAQIFAPHLIELCTESNLSLGAGADILGVADLLPIIAEIVKRGTRVTWYQTANATVPSTTGMVTTNTYATYQDLYWTVMKAQ